MKKILMIIGGVVLGVVLLGGIVIFVISSTSNKLVCKSNEGNITIMYNDKTLTGYSAKGISFDYDGQKKIAEQIGVDVYLTEFATWFGNNTTGTCTR